MGSAAHKSDFIFKWVRKVMCGTLRICLRHSIKLPEIIELLKLAYVDVAQQELLLQGLEVSASKLSAMTGVHRKDIARFRKSDMDPNPKANIVARVILQWQHDQRFTTKSGAPRVLTAAGRDSEFAKLVESVNGGDLGAYAVLYEMERLGALAKVKNKLKLLWKDYAPTVSAEEGLQMLAEDVNELYSAVEANIEQANEVPNLHLKTEFTKVAQARIPEIRKWILSEGSLFHRKVASYLSKFDLELNQKLNQKQPTVEVAVVAFSNIRETRQNV